jgi:hypothetical protein
MKKPLQGFDSQKRSGVFVRQQIQKTVRTLMDFPNSLLQFEEERGSPRWLSLRVQDDALQLRAVQATHQDVAL